MRAARQPEPMHRPRTLLLLFILCCVLPGTSAARTLQQILNEGEIRVGVVLRMPWVIRTGPGELIGFEIDVANELATDLDVEVDIRVYPQERIVAALEAGEVDIIAAGLTITPARALHVNFSNPYSTTGISMATNQETTVLVSDLEDFDDSDYVIATVAGSDATELVARIFPQAESRAFETIEAASAALISGEVDAYLEEEPIPSYLALENPSTISAPLTGPLVQRRAGFAINKGDPDFLAFLNAWITSREADTWLPTIYGYWFSSLRWREP